jgi:hypothetical protein
MTAQEKYPYKNQNCFEVDESIKNISDEISNLNIKGDLNSAYLNSLRNQKIALDLFFNGKNCRAVIEKKRLEENAEILYNESIKQENSVIKKNYKEQYLYIGFGSVVLLVGLYIVKRQK